MNSRAQKPALLLLILLLIALAITSLSAMVGDFYATTARDLEKSWMGKEAIPESEILVAKQALSQALALAQSNPDYLQYAGHLGNWSFAAESPEGSDAAKAKSPLMPLREQSLERFRQTVLQRPYWPYAWSEMALLKAQMRQIDAEFIRAFNNAYRLGKNEKAVRLNLLNVGLGNWSLLKWDEQLTTVSLFQEMLQNRTFRQDMQALQIAEQYGMKFALCMGVESLDVEPRVIKRCRSS